PLPCPPASPRQFHGVESDPRQNRLQAPQYHSHRHRPLAARADHGCQSEEARSDSERVRTVVMAESIQQRLAAITPATDRMAAVKTIGDFLAELEKGTIRSATRDDDGVWHAQPWVKQGILTAFRVGVLADAGSGALTFIDKDTMPTRRFRVDDGVRIVPG